MTLTTPTGVILANLGTPEAPTTKAVRKYLAEFLWDPRVVEVPRPIWFCILYGIILPFRSPNSAKLYQSIWTDEGSPLLINVQQQAAALQQSLTGENIYVTYGMRYGRPSIDTALQQCREQGCQKIIVLPLYPQFSATTTASTFDAIGQALKTWREIPDIQFISHYYHQPHYIKAIADSIQRHWQQHKRADKLIFSFHGLPQQFVDKGDPYYEHCSRTTELIANYLHLADDDYLMTFQSRLGKAQWLQPYTDVTMRELSKQVASVDVICPGFSSDCLETLEEVKIQNRDFFLQAGGKEYRYISCLNAGEAHIELLKALVLQEALHTPPQVTNTTQIRAANNVSDNGWFG